MIKDCNSIAARRISPSAARCGSETTGHNVVTGYDGGYSVGTTMSGMAMIKSYSNSGFEKLWSKVSYFGWNKFMK